MKLRNLIVLLFTLLALTLTASATPILYNVTLTGTESGGAPGPYTFTTSPTLGDNIFTCLTDNINISVGQSWVAEDFAVIDFSAPIQTKPEQAYALETSFALNPTQTDWSGIHNALWFIMGTGGNNTSIADQTTSAYWYNNATGLSAATLSSYSSQFSVLIPELTNGNTNITVADLNQGVSQSFLVPGVPGTPQVPEPATFMLVGGALIALGIVGKKRRKA